MKKKISLMLVLCLLLSMLSGCSLFGSEESVPPEITDPPYEPWQPSVESQPVQETDPVVNPIGPEGLVVGDETDVFTIGSARISGWKLVIPKATGVTFLNNKVYTLTWPRDYDQYVQQVTYSGSDYDVSIVSYEYEDQTWTAKEGTNDSFEMNTWLEDYWTLYDRSTVYSKTTGGNPWFYYQSGGMHNLGVSKVTPSEGVIYYFFNARDVAYLEALWDLYNIEKGYSFNMASWKPEEKLEMKGVASTPAPEESQDPNAPIESIEPSEPAESFDPGVVSTAPINTPTPTPEPTPEPVTIVTETNKWSAGRNANSWIHMTSGGGNCYAPSTTGGFASRRGVNAHITTVGTSTETHHQVRVVDSSNSILGELTIEADVLREYPDLQDVYPVSGYELVGSSYTTACDMLVYSNGTSAIVRCNIYPADRATTSGSVFYIYTNNLSGWSGAIYQVLNKNGVGQTYFDLISKVVI